MQKGCRNTSDSPQTINKPPAEQVGGFVIQEKWEMKSKKESKGDTR